MSITEGGQPSICAVIPAFNESGNIGGVIADIRSHDRGNCIVVVDDGSSDATAEIAQALGVTVLRLPVNLGIGGAVQTGLKYAAANGFDTAFQFDGDGQHLAGELPNLLAPVLGGSADVAIGSRFRSGRSEYRCSFTRRIGIRVISQITSLLIGQRITDPTSGFRAYNRRALEFLANEYPQDYPEPEAIIALSRNGFSIQEVPVAMKARAEGKSSIGALGACYYMTKVLLAILVASIRTHTAEA
ncbi:glycosyl transferase family 2 [candidate division GN15 bacterium]|uniref:Glycosyl transferase family 2 n=1 Tax=candidate division GN15 bacterium TaxID=2072418 RepID=A0A855X9N6_9BACT|nr:MAG: glycosyl transferase family 2 [candidate division GN15 bacterium]